MPQKLWSIQVLRFAAAAMVVHLHAAERSQMQLGSAGLFGRAATLFGHAGVDLFFVISGVIIYRTGAGLRPGEFLAKRARRILPMWWLAAVPLSLTAMLAGSLGWRDMLATFALWPATDRLVAPFYGLGWTLCFELLFYLAFALVLWRRWAAVGVLGGLLFALAWPRGALLTYIGNPIILEFLAGDALARLPRAPWAIWALPIGTGALLAGAMSGWIPADDVGPALAGAHGWLRLAACGLPATMIVLGALQVDWREGLLTRLGDASYAIYLVHLVVVVPIVLLAKLAHVAAPDVVIAIAALAGIWVGYRVHVLVEKPLQRFLSQRALLQIPARA